MGHALPEGSSNTGEGQVQAAGQGRGVVKKRDRGEPEKGVPRDKKLS